MAKEKKQASKAVPNVKATPTNPQPTTTQNAKNSGSKAEAADVVSAASNTTKRTQNEAQIQQKAHSAPPQKKKRTTKDDDANNNSSKTMSKGSTAQSSTAILSDELKKQMGIDDEYNPSGSDSNVLIIEPKAKKEGKDAEKRKPNRKQLRKIKALQEKKAKEKLREELYQNLQQKQLNEQQINLLRSTKSMGQKETLKQKLRRALTEKRAGVPISVDVRLTTERELKEWPANQEQEQEQKHEQEESETDEEQQDSEEEAEGGDDKEEAPVKEELKTSEEAEKQENVEPVVANAPEIKPTETQLTVSTTVQSTALGKPEDMQIDVEITKKQQQVDSAFSLFEAAVLNHIEASSEETKKRVRDETAQLKAKITELLASQSTDNSDAMRIEDTNTSAANTEQNDASITPAPQAPQPLRRPFYVPVYRDPQIQKQRMALPVCGEEQQIMEAISENDVVIICGETGSGKTTQLPQFLYEAGYGSPLSDKPGMIGVTQPRRVAAISTAKRVAQELNVPFGSTVAYQVRYDANVSNKTQIKFMTDGILLKEVQSDFLLSKYSAIILDEAHERNLNTDILIGLLSRIVPLRAKLFQEQQEKQSLNGDSSEDDDDEVPKVTKLKLIIMSATLRVEDFTKNEKLFPVPPPVIKVGSRQYPVTVHFNKRTVFDDYVNEAFHKVVKIHKKLPSGGILVFLTGQQEIEALCRKLDKFYGKHSKKTNKERAMLEAGELVDEDDDDDILDSKEEALNRDEEAEMAIYKKQGDAGASEPNSSSESDSESESEKSDTDTASDSDNKEQGKDSTSEENDDKPPRSKVEADDSKAAESAKTDSAGNEKEEEENPEDFALSDDEGEADRQTLLDEEYERDDDLDNPHQEKPKFDNKTRPKYLHVLPLYSLLAPEKQLRVFEPPPEGTRLCVIATNVAETSLTIPGIRYVVDTGRHKERKFDKTTGVSSFEIRWTSKASADQRAGRAGRTGPGHCYRLYTGAVFDKLFPQFSEPEILNTPIESVVLQMKTMGIDKVLGFPFPTMPDLASLKTAVTTLQNIAALDKETEKITPLGKSISVFPVNPRYAKMLVLGKQGNCMPYIIAIVSALTVQQIFVNLPTYSNEDDDAEDGENNGEGEDHDEAEKEAKRKKKQKEQAQSRAKWENRDSDLLAMLKAVGAYEFAKGSKEVFCATNFLHAKNMREVHELRSQISSIINKVDPDAAVGIVGEFRPPTKQQEIIIRQLIAAGFIDQVARKATASEVEAMGAHVVLKKGRWPYIANNLGPTKPVFIHPTSFLCKVEPEYVVYHELVETTQVYMKGVTAIHPSWLSNLGTTLCTFSKPLYDTMPPRYNVEKDRITYFTTPTFGSLKWTLPNKELESTGKNDPLFPREEELKYFARFLLEGKILTTFADLKNDLTTSPNTITHGQGRNKKVEALLAQLDKLETLSKRCLLEQWAKDPKFMLKELLEWLSPRGHERIKKDKLWPPAK